MTVDGVERSAVVYPSSSKSGPAPLVFVWHGFTGNARQAAFSYHLHTAWPEATVIYPQGLEVELLNRKGPGWQTTPKALGERDLKFFDAMLEKARSEYRADPARIYTCGMSNGAIFSYVLLRGNAFAAAAPVAGYAPAGFRGAPAVPILIVHGKQDPLVPFRLAERSRDLARANNGAGEQTSEWRPGYVQYAPTTNGNDVVWAAHDGGHTWPSGTSEAIVAFFKAHARPRF